MLLEGQVTNVAAFGAFVDVGVHQDGLVHVSAMSSTFVSDPREVVKSGDVVRVKVLEVDEARKRISLTLRLDDEPGAAKGPRGRRDAGEGAEGKRPSREQQGRGQEGRNRPGREKPGREKPGREQQGRDQQGRGGGRQQDPRRDGRGGSGGGSGGGIANSAMADALRKAGLAKPE
jgi:uncharacterized protein